MAKRKMVDVGPHHAQLKALQDEARARGKLVPTIPWLVNHALKIAMPSLVQEWMGKQS